MYRLVVAHGDNITKSKARPGTSVPPNKILILSTSAGDLLSYRGAHYYATAYLKTQLGVNAFMKRAKEEKGFRILQQGEQYADSVLRFYDSSVWTGVSKLPNPNLKIIGGSADMVINSPKSPPRKRISTLLAENPNKKEVIIVFACRGVEGVPARIAEGVGKRKTPLRTTSQLSRLRTIQAINQRKAIKRKQSKSPSSTSKPKTKKQKTSPFTTMMKTLKSTFTIGRSK